MFNLILHILMWILIYRNKCVIKSLQLQKVSNVSRFWRFKKYKMFPGFEDSKSTTSKSIKCFQVLKIQKVSNVSRFWRFRVYNFIKYQLFPGFEDSESTTSLSINCFQVLKILFVLVACFCILFSWKKKMKIIWQPSICTWSLVFLLELLAWLPVGR